MSAVAASCQALPSPDLATARRRLEAVQGAAGRVDELRQLSAQLEGREGSAVGEECRRVCGEVERVREQLEEAVGRLERGEGEETFTVRRAACPDKSSSATSDDCETIEDTVVLPEDSEGSEVVGGREEDTVYHSSPTSSAAGLHVFSSSASTGPGANLRSEVFLTVGAVEAEEPAVAETSKKVVEEEVVESMEEVVEPAREPCKVEVDLASCRALVAAPLALLAPTAMEELLAALTRHQAHLTDIYMPASLSEEEAARLVAEVTVARQEMGAREGEVGLLVASLDQWREELSGLTLWMREVEVFLHAEEAALGDMATLEAQLKESNALQDDIETLQPNVDIINDTGACLLVRCAEGAGFRQELEQEVLRVNTAWEDTVRTASAQNSALAAAIATSREVTEMVREINVFLDQLEGELEVGGEPVRAAPELSQRTYRLLQLRDRTERKGEVLERLSLVEVERGVEGGLGATISAVQERWGEVTAPVLTTYTRMKEATTDYGEFKTLVAQESDWLDRLEKKLRRSSKAAADAEEISEELDDIENCLNNHPVERIARLRLLAEGLRFHTIPYHTIPYHTIPYHESGYGALARAAAHVSERA